MSAAPLQISRRFFLIFFDYKRTKKYPLGSQFIPYVIFLISFVCLIGKDPPVNQKTNCLLAFICIALTAGTIYPESIQAYENPSGSISVLSGTAEEKIAALQAQFPAGKFWNHHADDSRYTVESVTDQPCANHRTFFGKPYQCSFFNNGYQCAGFAFVCYYKFHGILCHENPGQTKWINGNQGIKVGDVVHTGSHWMFVTKITDDWMSVMECNFQQTCMIDHGRVVNTSEIKGYYTPVRSSSPSAQATQDAPAVKPAPSSSVIKTYRLYSKNNGEHIYTQSDQERSDLILKYSWIDEGICWLAPAEGIPVYRLYNPNSGDHHYTLSTNEKTELVKMGWKDEGIAWYSAKEGAAVYRLCNPNAKAGTHHYTKDVQERDLLVLNGWKNEGIAWQIPMDGAL